MMFFFFFKETKLKVADFKKQVQLWNVDDGVGADIINVHFYWVFEDRMRALTT